MRKIPVILELNPQQSEFLKMALGYIEEAKNNNGENLIIDGVTIYQDNWTDLINQIDRANETILDKHLTWKGIQKKLDKFQMGENFIFRIDKDTYSPDAEYLEAKGDLVDLDAILSMPKHQAQKELQLAMDVHRFMMAACTFMQHREIRDLMPIATFRETYPNLYTCFEIWAWG